MSSVLQIRFGADWALLEGCFTHQRNIAPVRSLGGAFAVNLPPAALLGALWALLARTAPPTVLEQL